MVHVIDDNSSVRQSLKSLLGEAGVSVVCFGTAREFLHSYSTRPAPGCLLIDLVLPDADGFDLYQSLRQMGYVPPVIFLTGEATVPMSVKAMKAGAFDFIPKPFDHQQLLLTIVEALEKDSQEKHSDAELVLLRKLVDHLTDRELQVFQAVSEGLLNKQISARLNIVEQTVKVHRAWMMKKLNVSSVAAIVRMADKLDRSGSLPDFSVRRSIA